MTKERTNQRLIRHLVQKLAEGQKKYGQDIPLKGEGGRDNLDEAYQEALDLSIYLMACILELKDRQNEDKQYG